MVAESMKTCGCQVLIPWKRKQGREVGRRQVHWITMVGGSKTWQGMGRGSLTQGSQPCASAHCEVQTGSGIGSLQTHRPCQRRQGGSRSGCHLAPGEHRRNKRRMGAGTALLMPALPHLTPQVHSVPAHREGSAGQGPGNPHSGLSRRTFSAAAASHALLPPVPSVSARGPASSLEHRQYP